MFVIKSALSIFVRILDILILARILLSFFPSFKISKIADIINLMTEPILAPCRAFLQKIGMGTGMLDFSPILAYLVLRIVEAIVYSL